MGEVYKFTCISESIEFIKSLKRSGMDDIQVRGCRDYVSAIKETYDSEACCIIVDLDADSLETCKRLRKRFEEIAIVLVCENTSIKSNIQAWDAGVDVVMSKPVEAKILLAQCRALANRHRRQQAEYTYVADATLRGKDQLLMRDGKKVNLARRETAILKLLLRYRGHTVQREQLHAYTQKYDRPCTDNVLDVHISNLRRKFAEIGLAKESIKTIYGVGYKLEE